MSRTCLLIGAPIDAGQRYPGCLMGPAAYRTAGIDRALTALGHTVTDMGDVALPSLEDATCANPAVHSLAEVLGWTAALREAGQACRSSWAAIIRFRSVRSRGWRPMPMPWVGRCSCFGSMRIRIFTRR
jgi:arginase family enzyme